MCLIGVAINEHKDYPFILVANRDEFYNRPTKEAHYWPENPLMLAGKDLEKGGTWLGISKEGKLAALTNYRELDVKQYAHSRGQLVTSFINSASEFEKILKNKNCYPGFNLLYGTTEKLVYTSNRDNQKRSITKGIHVLANASLNSPWPKAMALKKGLHEILSLSSNDGLEQSLFQLLSDEKHFNDELLPDTGVGLTLERKLSPIFINIEGYGTRSSTVIMADRKGNVTFTEKAHAPKSHINTYEFKIGKNTFNKR
ncbi:NRDE family protein [Salipaludibacillus sp. CF4.18]|uniref:NRDE family protein n=1 Tax=Salipaludibacillus sp. CF4.18 TaxID=3373081 RepID=UPI003EE57CF1